ncbi:MAG: hypothetical protein H7A50_15460 [Akkermansiaceae bacterium]|nr:hypothetical protein [Akkermansiaceae bacterium]
MEATGNGNEVRKRTPRAIIGLVAALPFLVPQLIYISDIHGWNVALSYGLFFLVVPAAFVVWIVYAVVETQKRRLLSPTAYRAPWFSIGGIVFLVTFFHVGQWAQPLALKVPAWCRVNQVIEWNTSKPDEKHGGTHSYVLVLVGRGNIAEHDFTSGYLNWTGDQPAGFSDVDPDDRTFSHWVGYDHVTIPATLDVLRERVRNSGIPEDEVTRISGEIWEVIEQAGSDSPVNVRSGSVEPVWEAPFDHEETILGASIWMALLVGSFQVISWRSLPPIKQMAEAGTSNGG